MDVNFISFCSSLFPVQYVLVADDITNLFPVSVFEFVEYSGLRRTHVLRVS